ncbi:MAG: hypothetical protein ABIH79_00340 [archaeon]
MKNVVEEIKRKKTSSLPNSIIERVAGLVKNDVKESRALLRKYFGVFLTNRVLKSKGSADEILKMHMSSRKRDYEKFYAEIFEGIGNVESIIDLGCGVNGFSYPYLKEILGEVNYVGIEAVGQLVENMNGYFEEETFSAKVICADLFEIEQVLKILKGQKCPRVILMFQVVDALENLEKNFSKEFLLRISKECEWIVLSLPTESLSGRKRFDVQRKWIVDFLKESFIIEKDFVMNGERIIVIKKKTNN